MVGTVLRDISAEGWRFEEAEALLGVPDGGGQFESYWTIFVEVGFTTLDSPGLGFMSSTGMDAPPVWSYGAWEFPAGGR